MKLFFFFLRKSFQTFFFGEILFMRTQMCVNKRTGKLAGLDEINHFFLPQTKCFLIYLESYIISEKKWRERKSQIVLVWPDHSFFSFSFLLFLLLVHMLSSPATLLFPQNHSVFVLGLCLELAQSKQSWFFDLHRDFWCQGYSLMRLMSARWPICALTELVQQGLRATMK